MEPNPILEELVLKIRDPSTGAKEFRDALERIGECLGYEAARYLDTRRQKVTTVLGRSGTHEVLREQPVLVGILRAGMPLLYGLQRAFPDAEAGFIGAMRDEQTLKAHMSYVALPSVENKTVILADTMLATGGSMADSNRLLIDRGAKDVIIVTAIASRPGLEHLTRMYAPRVFAAAIDPKLNEKGYIVPGLGDAGDRAYGKKVD